MTNKAKPLDLQTDIEKAANSFEAYLDSENEPPEEAQVEAEGDESVEEAVVEEEVVEEEVELEAEADDEDGPSLIWVGTGAGVAALVVVASLAAAVGGAGAYYVGYQTRTLDITWTPSPNRAGDVAVNP